MKLALRAWTDTLTGLGFTRLRQPAKASRRDARRLGASGDRRARRHREQPRRIDTPKKGAVDHVASTTVMETSRRAIY
jgi:hypothetical protein